MLGMASAQSVGDNPNYKKEKLKLEEVNFIGSYYSQDGNNSAVTGGIGTEYLYDISNSIDFKLTKIDKKKRKHTLLTDINLDYYSSASSDNVNLNTVSGPSRDDVHFYPSLNWSMKDDSKGHTIGAGVSYSHEWDYFSKGVNLSYAKLSKDKNTEIGLKLNMFLDNWDVIIPAELRSQQSGQAKQNLSPRNTYNAALSWSRVINKDLQISAVLEPTYQSGLLATSFHRVYFSDASLNIEKLPTSRFKIPIGFRANYFVGDKVIIRSYYRYYQDDWGMKAHTFNLETPIKLSSFFSVSPYYRFNTQTAVKYFAPYQKHSTTETFYTSDYDLSAFDSHFVGSGLRYSPVGGVLGIKSLNMIELRYGHYWRSNTLSANIVTLQMRWK